MSCKSFGISKPLMGELLKMYWYVPAFSFVLYFFAGIFPILANLHTLSDIEYYVNNLLGNTSLAYVALLTIIPMVAAALMMDFIHNDAKALTMHCQPISKNRTYVTRYLTGWLMCIVPVFMNAIICIGFCMVKEIPYDGDRLDSEDVLIWLFSSIAIITFIYGIYFLVGTLTGTTTMHILISAILFVILPLIFVIIVLYCEMFLSGWGETPEWLCNITWGINPIIRLWYGYEISDISMGLLYFVIGIVFAICGKLIYATRKLELVGTSMLSKVFEEILICLVVFIGMCSFGFLVTYFSISKAVIVVGMIFGMVFTFTIVEIVLKRSFKCFDKSMLRPLIASVIIGIIFMSFTVFDVSGYEKRVPEAEDVQSVEISNFIWGYDFSNGTSGSIPEEYCSLEQIVTSKACIKDIINLHEYIIDKNLAIEYPYIVEYSEYGDEMDVVLRAYDGTENTINSEYITIVYNLKNGKTIKRFYDVVLNTEVAQKIDKVITSSEYKDKAKIENCLKIDKIKYIEIVDYYTDSVSITDDHEFIEGLLKAKDKDIESYGYLEYNPMYTDFVADIRLYFVAEDVDGLKNNGKTQFMYDSMQDMLNDTFEGSKDIGDSSYLSVEIKACDTNAKAFLEANGYGSILGE